MDKIWSLRLAAPKPYWPGIRISTICCVARRAGRCVKTGYETSLVNWQPGDRLHRLRHSDAVFSSRGPERRAGNRPRRAAQTGADRCQYGGANPAETGVALMKKAGCADHRTASGTPLTAGETVAFSGRWLSALNPAVQPPNATVRATDEAIRAANKIGYRWSCVRSLPYWAAGRWQIGLPGKRGLKRYLRDR